MLRVALLAALAVPAAAGAQIAADVVATDLRNPVAVVADPLDPAVSFVVEQAGQIRVLVDGVLQPVPFLDLADHIAASGERGLLGFAIETPDAEDSAGVPGRVFVNFTNTAGDTVVARFRRAADDPRRADPATRKDLVWPDGRAFIAQPFSNHNGGHLAFGPDGCLYVGMGDGGNGGDPMHLAQAPASLLGKLLRLDVGVADDDARGYRVPPDNPFVAGPIAAAHEIWAFGLRNPWRFAFDDPSRGGSGALYIGDVGQNAREEISYQPPGAGGLNFGWRLREGRRDYDRRQPAAYLPLTDPIHDYEHTVGRSVTGGVVYRGATLDPSMRGRYFFGDFITGRVFSLAIAGGEDGEPVTATDVREHTAALGGSALGLVSTFGVDADGEILVVSYGGQIRRIVPDLTVVPEPPRGLSLTPLGGGWGLASWAPSSTGVPAQQYGVERLSPDHRRVLDVFDVGPATTLRIALDEAGPCVRVRGAGRAAAGPPTAPACLAELLPTTGARP